MIPIKSLAEDARYAVQDLIDDDRWGWFIGLTDTEQVQWRYCHSDCDDFALTLHEITGWPVVAINNPGRGPIHRLVMTPDGQMLDAKGWVTLEDLRQRYRLKRLDMTHDSGFFCPTVEKNEDFHPIIDSILQLSVDPFNDVEFKSKVQAFKEKISLVNESQTDYSLS